MDRKQALEELKGRLTSENLVKHSIAVEAVMRKLAEHFKENEGNWALSGLLHDIDIEKTQNDPLKHGILGAEILENLGLDNSIVYAVKAHNDKLGLERKRKLDKALYLADLVSSLIIGCALTLPSKKLKDLNENYILDGLANNKFDEFASIQQIIKCTEIDLTLEEFISLSLKALQYINQELEL